MTVRGTTPGRGTLAGCGRLIRGRSAFLDVSRILCVIAQSQNRQHGLPGCYDQWVELHRRSFPRCPRASSFPAVRGANPIDFLWIRWQLDGQPVQPARKRSDAKQQQCNSKDETHGSSSPAETELRQAAEDWERMLPTGGRSRIWPTLLERSFAGCGGNNEKQAEGGGFGTSRAQTSLAGSERQSTCRREALNRCASESPRR
jgi:hypothetical protein